MVTEGTTLLIITQVSSGLKKICICPSSANGSALIHVKIAIVKSVGHFCGVANTSPHALLIDWSQLWHLDHRYFNDNCFQLSGQS